MMFLQTLVIFVCSFSVIKADGASNGKLGQDIVKELMDLTLKVKCQSSETNGIQQKTTFTAVLTKTTSLSANMVIKFDDVMTNIGKGYDSKTGVFSAPKFGIYEFSVNFIKSNNPNWLELDLIRNDNMLARGFGSKSPHSSGSIRAIAELKKGDRIFVKHPRGSGEIYGNKYSMFSGHLM